MAKRSDKGTQSAKAAGKPEKGSSKTMAILTAAVMVLHALNVANEIYNRKKRAKS